LQYPGFLLPFTVLSQTNNRIGTLQQVAQEIIKISDQPAQNRVTGLSVEVGKERSLYLIFA
jgi:hypothetical protein